MEVEGVAVEAVVDTGSEVSTVTQEWFGKSLKGRDLQQVNWLTLKAANGLDIPYVGLLEGRVKVFGQHCNATILVTKTAASQSPPAILGMNILQQVVPGLQSAEGLQGALQAVTRAIKAKEKEVVGLARVAGKQVIPASSLATIQVTGVGKQAAVAEPHGHTLPAGLLVVPTLVGDDKAGHFVRVANLTLENITLLDRTPLAALLAVQEVESDKTVTVSIRKQELVVAQN